jgi:hypothetical protein
VIEMAKDNLFGRKSSCCDCCGKRTIGFRQVKVGSCCMEIEGLEDIFREYTKKGMTPDEVTGAEMIKDIRALNFIPEDAEDLYKEALLKEYKSYYSTQNI